MMKKYQALSFGTTTLPMKRTLLPLLPHLLKRARMGPSQEKRRKIPALKNLSP
jgi:hypothetical protein